MEIDDLGDAATMRAALIEAGFQPVNLLKCVNRGKGPPVAQEGTFGGARRPTLFRWGDVLAWAEARPNGRKSRQIDLGSTTLGQWLREQAMAPSALARRLEMSPVFIHRLIGHRNSQWVQRLPPPDILQLVSLETGIPLGQLVEDAINVGSNTNGKRT